LAKPQVVDGRLSFETAASQIVDAFKDAILPSEIADAILLAYENLEASAVSIRSSATAEDLPEYSFAGLHDTFLNVVGTEGILDSVQRCWMSLWNSRAMSYRHEVGIESGRISMAIVVQKMVTPDVSGVLFTANPVNGDRTEFVVNASYGLGDAIVSGEITPDTFVIDQSTCALKSTTIGDKRFTVVADKDGGTGSTATDEQQRNVASISEAELKPLLNLSLAIQEDKDGVPQDIEWLISQGKTWILQSRPITNLPPPPLSDVRWDAPEPSAFLGRSQLVEHIPGPVSPLFEDLHMKGSLQRYWGMNLTRRGNHSFEDTQPPNSFIVQTTVNGYAYRHLGEPPRTGYLPRKKRERSNPLFTALRRFALNIRRRWMTIRMWLLWIPEWKYSALPKYLRAIERWKQIKPSTATVEQLWAGIRALSLADARYWYRGGVWNAFSLTRGTEFALDKFLEEHGEGRFSTGLLLSGLPSPAFEANRSLWRIAEAIRVDSSLFEDLLAIPPAHWESQLRDHPQGTSIVAMLDAHIQKYGHQVFTLDFVELSEGEETEQLGRTLQSLVLRADYDPQDAQHNLVLRRKEMLREVRRVFQGKLRWRFEWLHWRARLYYPNREAAMSHLGRAWTVLRPFAAELGQRLADRGTLTQQADIYFLTVDELGRAIRSHLAGHALPELGELTQQRRQLRESRKRLDPPMHVGKPPVWIKDRIEAEERDRPPSDMLTGSAVSPGTVTARASVILSTGDFSSMRSDTILVCPTTTPAWTQLFPQAVGLVTDIGGMLAHGSIVAREYGIPAVLGTRDATKKIADGQTITLDGNKGNVHLGPTDP
ncbi:MAG: PEP-utilizing enzyme, partial [Gammaproteobacteria bacterium]|nr:PEP-utilizing enzyme [Gammaproteobacteria bacterium]